MHNILSTSSGAALPVGRAWRALDALNFFLADVRGGLGPYLAVYLLTVQNWNEAEIGAVMSIGGVAGILAQTPAGALADAIRSKRAVVALAALAVTAGSLLLPYLSSFSTVALSQATVGAIGSIFGRLSRPSRWVSSAMRNSRAALDVTRPSIIPATPSLRQWPAAPRTFGARASSSS